MLYLSLNKNRSGCDVARDESSRTDHRPIITDILRVPLFEETRVIHRANAHPKNALFRIDCALSSSHGQAEPLKISSAVDRSRSLASILLFKIGFKTMRSYGTQRHLEESKKIQKQVVSKVYRRYRSTMP